MSSLFEQPKKSHWAEYVTEDEERARTIFSVYERPRVDKALKQPPADHVR